MLYRAAKSDWKIGMLPEVTDHMMSARHKQANEGHLESNPDQKKNGLLVSLVDGMQQQKRIFLQSLEHTIRAADQQASAKSRSMMLKKQILQNSRGLMLKAQVNRLRI